MMRKFYTSLIFTLFTSTLFAQAPEGFNYQALIRNNDGGILTSSEVNILIEIISESESGPIIYSENHLIETDENGMVHLIIGQGTTSSGDFLNIDWGNTNHFIQTSLDATGGTEYETIALTQLMSVPYAIHSNSTGNFTGKSMEINGNGSNENMITLKNDNYSRIAAYAANNDLESVASFVGLRSGGTVDNPTNIRPEQRISGFYGSSYFNNDYEVSTAIEFFSGKESGSNGSSSYIKFGTTDIGSTQRLERMRIAENGNVGIGTNTPNYDLEVNGTLNVSEIYQNGELIDFNKEINEPIELVGSGQNENMITLKNDNYSRIAAYAANNDFESVASFVGLRSGGTVDNPTNIGPEQRISGFYGSSYFNNDYEVSTAIEFFSGKESGSNGSSSYIKFGTTDIGSTQRLERMRIAENGNVGIGTTIPKSKLQVTNGDIYIEDASSGVIMTSPDGNCWRMTVDNTGNPQFSSITCPE
ncbi:hypothetical protein [Marivirga sp.]|uniref:hypothetical protein n=1 Tax=Marivirga sp. TaxID=2018662 RepID=UPI003DA6F45F